jgi:pimeloyl-ACP methyl ester carboxylesterase
MLASVSAEPETIQANGLRFAYLAEGEGPLVLLLHGFPDTARSWDRTRVALAEAGFRAVSPWMRGYAPTEIPAEPAYDADTLGRDVVELVRALGEKDAIVVGHDWGALAAYMAAGVAPDVVRKLVTIGIPHPASMKPSLGLLWTVRHFFTLRLPGSARRIRAGGFAHVDELVRRWSPTWNPDPEETVDVKRAFAEPGCIEAAIGYYRAVKPILPGAASQDRGAVGFVRGHRGHDRSFALRPRRVPLSRRLRGRAHARRALHAPRAPRRIPHEPAARVGLAAVPVPPGLQLRADSA